MDAVSIIALSMGAAWASGINLYATVFMLGYMGMSGNMTLPAELEVLADPMVMTAAGFMYCVEFFADKIPGVDSGWDTIHTFIRIPAGAMLASSAIGDVGPAMELTTALLGGTLAAGTHTTKAGTRLLINTSPEPFTNWTASISEDLLVIGGLWAALNHPVLFVIGLIVFILIMIWLLPRLWRLIKHIFRKIGSWLGLCDPPQAIDKQLEPEMTNKGGIEPSP
ncbi:MAG: DUF4126 family protein [Methylophaga sp.]|nr:DUF4126 family protein [Methylophaga sp.]